MNFPKRFNLSHQQFARWRWIGLLVIFGLAGFYQLVVTELQPWIPEPYRPWLAVILYGGTGGLAAWLAMGWLVKTMAHQEQTQTELQAAYETLAETHRQLLAVHDIGREIALAPDMQHILEVAARAPAHLAGAIGSTVVTFDEEGDRLKLDMAWGLSDDYLASLRRRMEAGISMARCRHCRPLTANLGNGCALFEGLEPLARREGIHSLICLPITRHQKREGVINAFFPSPDGPPEEQIQLLNIVATEIVAALDSVRLRTNQMATLYAMKNLTQVEQSFEGQIQQIAMLEERYRLSREIHDGLAQALSSLGWQLDHLKGLLSNNQLDQLRKELLAGRRMVREAYKDVREVIDGLRPYSDPAVDLPTAVQRNLADFEKRTGIRTSLEVGAGSLALSAEAELHLLRIVQEALINVRKHAQAQHVWIRLHTNGPDDRLTLTIADDGKGFDPALPRGRGHLGLATMRERAESQNGDFTLITGPNQGTQILVNLPPSKVRINGACNDTSADCR